MSGPCKVDLWDSDEVWKLSRKDKKNLMGRFRVEAGGPVDPGLAGTSKWKTKEEEPVWFYAKPYKLCESLCHAYYAKAIVDFSPASGQFAMVAMRKRLPYVGITCSEMHTQELLKYLLVQMKAAKTDPDDPLYDETLVEDKCETPPGKKPKTPPGKKPKTTNKPGGAGNGKSDLMAQLKKAMEATAEEGKDGGDDEGEES